MERQLVGSPYPEPDVTHCGVTVFMQVAHLAESMNLPVTSHGAHDITVHLLAAAPNRSHLEAHGFGLERFVAPLLKIESGFAIAPQTLGHKLTFDRSSWLKRNDNPNAESATHATQSRSCSNDPMLLD